VLGGRLRGELFLIKKVNTGFTPGDSESTEPNQTHH